MYDLDEASIAIGQASAEYYFEYESDLKLIIPALLAAEDHRAPRHRGIDFFSIFRAIVKAPISGKVCGISTIEQQLARTIFLRTRGRKMTSKLREMVLSVRIANRHSKIDTWSAYLWVGYFGERYKGYKLVRRKFLDDSQPMSLTAASCIVSCFKYPIPVHQSDRWELKHQTRVSYVLKVIAKQKLIPFQVPVQKKREFSHALACIFLREKRSQVSYCEIDSFFLGARKFFKFSFKDRSIAITKND